MAPHHSGRDRRLRKPERRRGSCIPEWTSSDPVPPMPLFDWPLLRQLRTGADGTGSESMSRRTRELSARTADAAVARSVCPYCGVGCGQRIFHRDGKLVAIDGDPESPINQGTLCPKGAASFQLLTHERRLARVLHRPPGATAWQTIDLDA